jgi:hypothetical protein
MKSTNAETIDNISSEAKWDSLRNRQNLALFERYSQVDVNKLGCGRVNEDILHMPVSQSDHVADYTSRGATSCVGVACSVPRANVSEGFGEKVTEDRFEFRAY